MKMKKSFKLFLTILTLMGIGLASFDFQTAEDNNEFINKKAENGTYSVDVSKSTLKWVGRKITYGHQGTIDLASGNLVVTDNEIKGGEFEIDMNTIVNLDLEDEAKNKKLTNHLRSSDFFNVSKFPRSYFRITSIKKIKSDQGNYDITGDLTIKGITNEITFPADIQINGETITASANLTFDRSKYDVRYGSGSFFDNLGDKIIYDDIEMEVELVAVK